MYFIAIMVNIWENICQSLSIARGNNTNHNFFSYNDAYVFILFLRENTIKRRLEELEAQYIFPPIYEFFHQFKANLIKVEI